MEDNLQQPRIVILAKKVWPIVHRALTSAVYFIYKIISNGIKTAIEQIKNV